MSGDTQRPQRLTRGMRALLDAWDRGDVAEEGHEMSNTEAAGGRTVHLDARETATRQRIADAEARVHAHYAPLVDAARLDREACDLLYRQTQAGASADYLALLRERAGVTRLALFAALDTLALALAADDAE